MKLNKEKRAVGTIKTVKDFIKCLEGCNPEAKICTWPENLGFHIQEFSDNNSVCIHAVETVGEN